MKKNDWLIACGAILFAVLFYEQYAGINFLLFTTMYGILNVVFNRHELQKSWYFYYALHFCCAFNIFYLNSDLAVCAWLFSLICVSGQTLSRANSYFVSNLFIGVSFIASFGKMYHKLLHENKGKPAQSKLMYAVAILISLIIVLIFLFLYKGANPLFDNFTNKIDLSWLDLPFIFCCLFGFLLLFTLIYPYVYPDLSTWDKNKLSELTIEDEDQNAPSKKFAGLIAILVFFCLNLMLLSLNSLDIQSIFILEKLPKNIFLADFLHFSVSSIVFSILLAIVLIFAIQQFRIRNKAIKILMYFWIAQSLIMVINTFIRNYWYSFNQITYLRIGVFVFLSMCVFGLIYTAFCLQKKRNYWYLLNLNMQTWFFVLVFTSFFSWDRIITSYNLKFDKAKEIDLEYLNSLSVNNLDLMLSFYKKHPVLFKEESESFFSYSQTHEEILAIKLKNFKKHRHNSWQSYSYMDHFIAEKIK